MPRIVATVGCSLVQDITNANPTGLHADLFHGGWDYFLKQQVDPVLEWFGRSGVAPELLVYLPFGAHQNKDGPIIGPQFDAAIDSQNWKTSPWFGFAESWERITKQGRCWFYFGHLKSKRFTSLKDSTERDDFARRVQRSIDPVINCGGGLIVDSFTDYDADSLEWGVMQSVKAQLEGKLMLEGWPAATCPNLFRENVLLIDDVWRNAPLRGGAAPLDKLTGTIFRWPDEIPYTGERETGVATAEAIREIQKLGYVPVVPIDNLRKAGFTAGDFK